MKAIAIEQPFASLIALGIIDVWSMPFATDYCGRILLVASNTNMSCEGMCKLSPIWLHVLYNHSMMDNMNDLFFDEKDQIVSYPLGEVVGYADIVDCSDNEADFEGNIWYNGGIAWRFGNPHYCVYSNHRFENLPSGIFDLKGIDGRTTRHFHSGKPFFPYIKDGELFLQQSIDAIYDENVEDYKKQTTTIWYYADEIHLCRLLSPVSKEVLTRCRVIMLVF